MSDRLDDSERRGIAKASPRIEKIDRRRFLQLTGIAGGGLILGFDMQRTLATAADSVDFVPNAFLRIADDGIVIFATQPEMGQGIKTALPMIVAEELDASWQDVEVRQSPIDAERFGLQAAGGSTSIPRAWEPLRLAGATARAVLLAAAAQRWNVPAAECRTGESRVRHEASGRQLTYRELASTAARIPVPSVDAITLKTKDERRLLNTRIAGVDNAAIVVGHPLYSIDVRLPEMLYAVYVKCPRIGGRVLEANLAEIRDMPGVSDAFVIEGNGIATELKSGVAIVARDTWSAFSARKQLRIQWDETAAAGDDWNASQAHALAIADADGAEVLINRGNVDQAMGEAERVVEGVYRYSFLSHAQLEPQNCTAWFKPEGKIEVWAPSQTPQAAIGSISRLLGIPPSAVTIHPQRMGGSFGRRLMNDVACEAAAIARRTQRPVKLQWTREDDMTNDFVRAGGVHALKGATDKLGRAVAWRNHFITFSADGKKPVVGGDLRTEDDFIPLIPNLRYTRTQLPWSSPCGFWRSPGPSVFAFPLQSFLHEMSSAAGRDHLEFLLELLGPPRWLPPATKMTLHTGRAADVLRLAAHKAGWGRQTLTGRARGLAFYFSHAAYVAQIAEVSVDTQKQITVHEITVACDVGPIVNLAGAEAQCQGSIIDGLSAMADQKLTYEAGRILETNFDRYPLRRIGSEPRIQVHFLQTDNPPSGLGEPVLPPVAPAVCNAVYAACGHRIRSLPISDEGFAL